MYIWEYMRLCPDETNYSTIAKGAKVTRHTVSKHYELIQKMLGTKETASPCATLIATQGLLWYDDPIK